MSTITIKLNWLTFGGLGLGLNEQSPKDWTLFNGIGT